MEFSDQELKIHKNCCLQIIQDVEKVLLKMQKQEVHLAKEYYDLIAELEKSGNDFIKTRKILAEIELCKKKNIDFLVAKKAVEFIFDKNTKRRNYIDKIFGERGIYNQKIEKQTIKKIINENIDKIDAEGMLPEREENNMFLFYGSKLTKVNDKIDFSVEANRKFLENADGEMIFKLINNFPNSIKTITGEILIDTKLKNLILQKLTIYVFEQRKTKPIYKINMELGGLLNLSATNKIEGVGEYVFAVENLFNVMIKRTLCKLYPEIAQKIDEKLKCNESSKFLPRELVEVKND